MNLSRLKWSKLWEHQKQKARIKGWIPIEVSRELNH